jgi:hypothetical protein
VCEEVEIPEDPEENRFLEAMEGDYKFLLDDKTVKDNNLEDERFSFHRSKMRRLQSKSSSGKSCKSVKCSKSSKSGDGEVGVCR